MGFGQLNSILAGGNKQGQLLFVGKDIDVKNGIDVKKGIDDKSGSFKMVSGSNCERLTASQNETTRKNVAAALSLSLNGLDEDAAKRMEGIRSYLISEGRRGETISPAEVRAMIDILKDGKLGGRKLFTKEDVEAVLEDFRMEQDFTQLRKMTVESTFGLGNIAMKKDGGQFEKVNNHKFKKGENNIDITKLGGTEGKEQAWVEDEVAGNRIAEILKKHFTPKDGDHQKDAKNRRLNDALHWIGKYDLSLTDRQTLSGVIRFLESKEQGIDFFEKCVPKAKTNRAKLQEAPKVNGEVAVNEEVKVDGEVKVANDESKDEQCAKLFHALAQDVKTLSKEDRKLIAPYGGSDKLSKILFSPLGRHAIKMWKALNDEKIEKILNQSTLSKEKEEIKRDLDSFFVKVAKGYVKGPWHPAKRPDTKRPDKKIYYLFEDEASIDPNAYFDDLSEDTKGKYNSRFQYFMEDTMTQLVSSEFSGRDYKNEILLKAECSPIGKYNLANGKQLKDFINPPPSLFTPDRQGGGNVDTMIEMKIYKDAIYRAIQTNSKNKDILAKLLVEKNNPFSSAAKHVESTGAGYTQSEDSSIELEKKATKIVGLPPKDDFVKALISKTTTFKAARKALKETEELEKEVAKFATACGLNITVDGEGKKYSLNEGNVGVSDEKMKAVSKKAGKLIDRAVKFIERHSSVSKPVADELESLKENLDRGAFKDIIQKALRVINNEMDEISSNMGELKRLATESYEGERIRLVAKQQMNNMTFEGKKDKSSSKDDGMSNVAGRVRTTATNYFYTNQSIEEKEVLQKLLAEADIQNIFGIEPNPDKSTNNVTAYQFKQQ